jgi:hypothetical protein
MSGLRALPGERHGRLTLVEPTRKGSRAVWRCDCGAFHGATVSAVRVGHVRSCGCLHRDIMIKLRKVSPDAPKPGEKHGRLTLVRVVAKVGGKGRTRSVGLWRCDCGRGKTAHIAYVRIGQVQSCGCLVGDTVRTWRTAKLNAQPGETHGRLTLIRAVRYEGHRSKLRTEGLWRCDCGNLTQLPFFQVRSGKTRSCGCLHSEVTSDLMREIIQRRAVSSLAAGVASLNEEVRT